MSKQALVAAVVGLLIAALAGMEWVAERQFYVHESAYSAEVADPGLSEGRDLEDTAASASPGFIR
jgi:hypothetical protein